MSKRVVSALLSTLFVLLPASGAAHASAYDGKPKLVVVLVLDQFRGDYLDRFRADFKTPHGFNLFLQQGAYFPECYYDYANTMTAPGHSTIGTGAYTNGHNIALNEWWDLSRSDKHVISSVDDEQYPLVGSPAETKEGASPRNELASTLGDEVVLATAGRAHLFGVSLKDRAAILTSGHAAQGAYWIDHETGRFESSKYYMNDLPAWVKQFNDGKEIAEARKQAGIETGDFYEQVGATPAGVSYELAFAKNLVEHEELGKHDVTDVLTLSISSTDILGHQVGPDDPRQQAMIDAVDVNLNDFFNFLDTHVDGGLANVWVSLTGDHGVAPAPAMAITEGMPAASFSAKAVTDELNRELSARFTPNEPAKFVLGIPMPYVQLDDRTFQRFGLNEEEAEKLVAAMLPDALDATQAAALKADPLSRALKPATVRRVYTKVQIAAGAVPNTEEGHLILHSYTTNGGWWVMMTPGMYQMAGYAQNGTTHFSPYAYDRHVPLAFYGAPFVPGRYLTRTAPVDIAATFAALLGINQPSACVGRVVTEALKPEVSGQGAK
jgi:arylsulfatase A-like enzyme